MNLHFQINFLEREYVKMWLNFTYQYFLGLMMIRQNWIGLKKKEPQTDAHTNYDKFMHPFRGYNVTRAAWIEQEMLINPLNPGSNG